MWVGLEKGRVYNGKLGNEIRLRALRRNEEVPGEKIVPGHFGIDAQRYAIALVGTSVAIERIGLSLREIGRHSLEKRVELAARVLVDVPNAGGFPNEVLILWRAAGMRTRVHDELSAGAEDTFASSDRVFDQRGSR